MLYSLQMALAGYKYLKSYQLTVVIYDLTVAFCNRYINPKSRTHDQMVQAARSGKQNIAEGSLEKSLKMYIKLVGVARASLGELLEDYQDYARLNKVQVWDKNHSREIGEIRDIWEKSTPNYPHIPSLPNNLELAVNLLLSLINQANYLLDRQITSLEQKFLNEGGYSENLLKYIQFPCFLSLFISRSAS